jgi:hypothetical protein
VTGVPMTGRARPDSCPSHEFGRALPAISVNTAGVARPVVSRQRVTDTFAGNEFSYLRPLSLPRRGRHVTDAECLSSGHQGARWVCEP